MMRALLLRLRGQSVITRAAITLSLVIGLIFVIAGLLVFQDARRQSLEATLVELRGYTGDIVADQEARFQRLAGAHDGAAAILTGELATLSAAEARNALDQLYPRAGDGSRRSIDALFDGGNTPAGFVRGVGAIMPETLSDDEARHVVAATRAVHSIGEGLRPDFKSLYYFSPRDALVMFAPDRPDRLSYYRREAPGDLSFQKQEFARIVSPERDPGRGLHCTSLQTILYDQTHTIWTTGCMSPVYDGTRQIGAIGTSIMLDDILDTSRFDGLPGLEVVLVSAEGRLIRHPRYTTQNRHSTERYLDLATASEPGLKALWALIQARGGGAGFAGHVPELGAYAALGRIPTPGWHVVTLQPDALVHAQAMRPVWRVAATALFCLILQATVLFLVLRRQVGIPLRRLSRDARNLARTVGGEDVVSPPAADRGDEVAGLSESFARMADAVVTANAALEEQVRDRTRELRQANGELRRMSESDALTGLANRRKLMDVLAQTLQQVPAGRTAIILFDIDHFKAINDAHGHLAGDRVLQHLARAGAALFRPSDTLGRLGGEEFLVVLPGATLGAALPIAERLRARIEALAIPLPQGGHVGATISLGIAASQAGDTAETLYHRADEALYVAKGSGRNQVRAALPGQAAA